MYTNEALAVNQWQGVTFNNSICKYANFSVSSIFPFPQISSEAQDIYNMFEKIMEAFKESIICHGEDVLKRLNFTSVTEYSSNIIVLQILFLNKLPGFLSS